jgi:hypothetical protein
MMWFCLLLRRSIGGVDFWLFLDFQYVTTELGLAKNSKIKEAKEFFLIFMSSYAEMSFRAQKSQKVTKTCQKSKYK